MCTLSHLCVLTVPEAITANEQNNNINMLSVYFPVMLLWYENDFSVAERVLPVHLLSMVEMMDVIFNPFWFMFSWIFLHDVVSIKHPASLLWMKGDTVG